MNLDFWKSVVKENKIIIIIAIILTLPSNFLILSVIRYICTYIYCFTPFYHFH